MDDRDYKAFIVEGEFREPQVIDNISKRFFNHGNCKLISLPAGENIYMLWKKLEADDFETDIIEVLRESSKELQKLLEGLSREDFSEVFLFFDYDAHQTNLGNADGQDALKQMLESFDNETENGKLYVSYTMVEALRDYEPNVCGNKESCFVYIPSLTVVERKNRCIPCIYWDTAILCFATEFSNLFPSFALFLNCFHFAFGYELIVGSKAADVMQCIRNRIPFVCWNKSLFLNLYKVHCF